MLNNYTYTVTSINTAYPICTAPSGKEITVLSIMINGGETGGDVSISIGDYHMSFTVTSNDTIVLDHKIVITEAFPMRVTASATGISFCVSVAEIEAK